MVDLGQHFPKPRDIQYWQTKRKELEKIIWQPMVAPWQRAKIEKTIQFLPTVTFTNGKGFANSSRNRNLPGFQKNLFTSGSPKNRLSFRLGGQICRDFPQGGTIRHIRKRWRHPHEPDPKPFQLPETSLTGWVVAD